MKNIQFPAVSTLSRAGLALASLLAGASAFAGTTLTMPGPNLTTSETLNFGNNGVAGATIYSPTVSAGSYQVNDGSSTFSVYCLDPLTWFVSGANYTVTSLSNFLNGTTSSGYYTQFNTGSSTAGSNSYNDPNIKPYYGAQNQATVLNALTSLYAHAYSDSLTSSTKAAAFQYAIWEIEGQSSYSTTSGGLTLGTSGALKTQADAYLAALTSSAWSSVNGVNLSSAANYSFTVYQAAPAGGTQTFLKVSNAVPEPGSMSLVAIGALVWVGSRRRAKKSALAV